MAPLASAAAHNFDVESDPKAAASTSESQPLVPAAPLKRDALLCVTFASLAGILLGYDVGMVAGVLEPIHSYYALGDRRQEVFVGSLNLMAFFGCFAVSPLADKYGRRSTLGMAAALFFVGNTLQAISWSYASLLFGRGLAGIAVGFTVILAPLYTAEVSPARIRGTLTTLMEISFNVGIVFGFFATWFLDKQDSATTWRFIIGMGSVPAVVLGLGTCFFMVESPRWLIAQGRMTEAQAVLDKVMEPEEARQVVEQMSTGEPEIGSWTALFTQPELKYPLFLGCMVAFFSQATGIESIQYYSVHILKDSSGLGRETVLLVMLVMGLVKLSVIFVATYLVDRVGRRPLLMVSGLGMAASMALLTVYATAQSMMPVVGMIMFVAFFSIGYGPLIYVFNGEIFPQAARSRGISVAMSVSRGLSTLVSMSFLSLVSVVSLRGAWMLFGSMALASTGFVCLVLPETRGKSLEERL